MLHFRPLAVLVLISDACSRLHGGAPHHHLAEPINGTRVWRPATFDFVDAVVHSVTAEKTRTIPPFTSQRGYGVVQTTVACRELQADTSDKFARFAESQHAKYTFALASYDMYRRSHGKTRRLFDYILGVSGYWELRAGEQNTTLLSSACAGLPQRWRDAQVVEGVAAGRPFAALTATFGDLLIGATSFLLRHQRDDPAVAFLWGQYQEAEAQASLELVFSGAYLDGLLPSDRNADPRVPFSLVHSPQAGPNGSTLAANGSRALSYVPQVVWHALTVDILAYGSGANPEKLERQVEEQGRQYARLFEEEPPRYGHGGGDSDSTGSAAGGAGWPPLQPSLLNATRQMLAKAEAVVANTSALESAAPQHAPPIVGYRHGSGLAGWVRALEDRDAGLPAAVTARAPRSTSHRPAAAAAATASGAGSEAGTVEESAQRLQRNVTAAVDAYWTTSGGKRSGRQMEVAPTPVLREICRFYTAARDEAAAAGYTPGVEGRAGAPTGAATLSCTVPE